MNGDMDRETCVRHFLGKKKKKPGEDERMSDGGKNRGSVTIEEAMY